MHGLIQQAARNGDFRGFSLCKRGPKLTHLFFADDNLLFYRVNETECEKALQVLAKYETSSGQKFNIDKTALVFSKSTSEENKDMIKSLLGIHEIKFYEKYLGLPSLVEQGTKANLYQGAGWERSSNKRSYSGYSHICYGMF